jgi:hypothetical protein
MVFTLRNAASRAPVVSSQIACTGGRAHTPQESMSFVEMRV